MYLRNFYSEIDDNAANAKKGWLIYYKLPERKWRFSKGKNICYQNFLYEYSMAEEYINDIERRFAEKIEIPTSRFLKKIIQQLYCSKINDVVLTDDDVDILYRFIISLLFRHPFIMKPLCDKARRHLQDINHLAEQQDIQKYDKAKKILLSQTSDLESHIISNVTEIFNKNYTIQVIKANKFNFFTTDFPVIFTGPINANSYELLLEDLDLYLPLNKDFCIALLSKKTHDGAKSKTLEIANSKLLDHLLSAALENSNIVISNCLTDDWTKKINSAYAGILKRKLQFEIIQLKKFKDYLFNLNKM